MTVKFVITGHLYDLLSTSHIKFVVVVITDLNLDKINHDYNHGPCITLYTESFRKAQVFDND